MDIGLILVRIVHVGSAMMWFGGAVIGAFFLQPTAEALGKAGQPFMEHLMRRRRMGVFFPIVAGLAVLSGAVLYWRDSGGLQAAWIASGPGLAFTIGGLAAVATFIGGMVLIGPAIAAQTAVQTEPRSSGSASLAQRDGCGWPTGSTSRSSRSRR
jgi:hypothetical protein